MTRTTVVIASSRKIKLRLDYEPKSEIKQAKDTVLHPANDTMIICNSNFHCYLDEIKDNGVNANIGAQSDPS